jgi:hypothetical protein
MSFIAYRDGRERERPLSLVSQLTFYSTTFIASVFHDLAGRLCEIAALRESIRPFVRGDLSTIVKKDNGTECLQLSRRVSRTNVSAIDIVHFLVIPVVSRLLAGFQGPRGPRRPHISVSLIEWP